LKRLGIATPVKIEKINWNIAVLKRQKHPTFLFESASINALLKRHSISLSSALITLS
jgi:hypothetical protein